MSEANRRRFPCCTEDGGRSSEPAFRSRFQTTRRGCRQERWSLAFGKSPGDWAGTIWKGDEQEPHMRRRNFKNVVKTEDLSFSRENHSVGLMNGCGVTGVDGARVQIRLQCGTWEPVVLMLMSISKWWKP